MHSQTSQNAVCRIWLWTFPEYSCEVAKYMLASSWRQMKIWLTSTLSFTNKYRTDGYFEGSVNWSINVRFNRRRRLVDCQFNVVSSSRILAGHFTALEHDRSSTESVSQLTKCVELNFTALVEASDGFFSVHKLFTTVLVELSTLN